MKESAPLRLIAGISIHLLLSPEKLKVTILKSLTINVTRNKTTADDTHLKRPKVTRFKGKSSKFITGFAKKNTADRATPEIKSVDSPLSKTIPLAILLITHKENVSSA